MSAGGYFRVHRQLEQSNVFENPLTFKVFMWCLMRASYKVRTIRFHRENVMLQPGQFITGRFAGAEACHMKPSTFRNQLNTLRSMGSIALKSDRQKTIISVLNWTRFQLEASGKDNEKDNERTQTRRKEGKRERQQRGERTPSPVTSFLSWWKEEYEKSKGKPYVVKFAKDGAVVKRLLADLSVEQLQSAARRFFAQNDAWISDAGHTVPIFAARINALVRGNGHRNEIRFLESVTHEN